jgi:hypothetical protein
MSRTIYDRKQRFQWYLQVDQYGKSVQETCRIFGIPRKTFYKWRQQDYGVKGNTYVASKKQPNLKLTWPVRKFIEEQKLKTNYGPLKMKLLVKRELGLDISTTIIYRYYQKKKLIRKPQRKLPWYQPMKQALIVSKQGQAVQMDVKYVYERGVRKFQFSVYDPFTCKYYFKVLETKESKNAITTFKEAQKYLGFKILSVQTDNGSEFRGFFHNWLTKRNIAHYFIPKSSPYWNAQVERVHRTIDDEYYHNPQRSWKTPYEWLDFYNFERIHLTLKGLTPQEKLESVTLDC